MAFRQTTRQGEDRVIARPPVTSRGTKPPVADDSVRINDRIRVPEVRLIDAAGEQAGIVSTRSALARAEEAGLDLVEVAPLAQPPVCKIMDYSKFKYQQSMRQRVARKKQVRIDVKEVKFRPQTDVHDYQVKLRSIQRFLSEGDKVKCTLRFRGREMAHQDLGLALLKRVEEDLAEFGKVEKSAALEGRQIVMVVAPSKKSG